MSTLDWIVMVGTLAFIAGYGTWKYRHQGDSTSYLKGDGELRWPTIGLSIMATQASAITFLSVP
ncbi:MAG: sodium:solute symporter, partial [Myxococcales bacterium]|nr:sodium:solute symporter [Myxococcales bacterium]